MNKKSADSSKKPPAREPTKFSVASSRSSSRAARTVPPVTTTQVQRDRPRYDYQEKEGDKKPPATPPISSLKKVANPTSTDDKEGIAAVSNYYLQNAGCIDKELNESHDRAMEKEDLKIKQAAAAPPICGQNENEGDKKPLAMSPLSPLKKVANPTSKNFDKSHQSVASNQVAELVPPTTTSKPHPATIRGGHFQEKGLNSKLPPVHDLNKVPVAASRDNFREDVSSHDDDLMEDKKYERGLRMASGTPAYQPRGTAASNDENLNFHDIETAIDSAEPPTITTQVPPSLPGAYREGGDFEDDEETLFVAPEQNTLPPEQSSTLDNVIAEAKLVDETSLVVADVAHEKWWTKRRIMFPAIVLLVVLAAALAAVLAAVLGNSGGGESSGGENVTDNGNDVCSNAISLLIPSSIEGSTMNATLDDDVGAGTPCEPSASGVWYTVQGTGKNIIASICTSYDAAISVFLGRCSSLQCMEHNDYGSLVGASCQSSLGAKSSAVWTSERDVAYSVLVHGNSNATGNFTLDVNEVVERDVLEVFYNATGGDSWTKCFQGDSNPCFTTGTPWLATDDPCEWGGVSCNDNGEVDSLDLGRNGLTGYLPTEIASLSALCFLLVYGNELRGSIPETLGDLKKLEFINLGNNELTGSIPDTLGDLSSQKYIILSSNKLTGSIPDTLGDLSNLVWLRIASNELRGSIPETLGSLQFLKQLGLENNKLTGSIPRVGSINLEYLSLHENMLTGSIPSSLCNDNDIFRLTADPDICSASEPGCCRPSEALPPTGDPPQNDDCRDALSVSSNQGFGSTLHASVDNGTPSCGGTTVTAPGVWYKVQGTGTRMTADTCSNSTNFDTKLTVFRGSSCSSLSCTGSDDDSCAGLSSSVSWNSTSGQEYKILVHGFGSAKGNFRLEITS